MIVGVRPPAAGRDEAEHVAHTLPGVLGLAGPAETADSGDLAGATVSTHVASGREGVAVVVPDTGGDGAAARAPTPTEAAAAVLDRFPGAAVVVSAAGDGDAVTAGPPEGQAVAWAAVVQATTRSSGRLVRFPGSHRLVGRLPVAEITSRSAVDEVRLVGGGAVGPGTTVDTRGFVRPVWEGGRTVLLLQRLVDGVLTPFEREHQRACGCDH